MLLQMRPGVTNGLWSVVTSTHSSLSNWSRRRDLDPAEVGRVVGDAEVHRLGVLGRRVDVVVVRGTAGEAVGQRRAGEDAVGRRRSRGVHGEEGQGDVSERDRHVVAHGRVRRPGGGDRPRMGGRGLVHVAGEVRGDCGERVVTRNQVGELGHDARLALAGLGSGGTLQRALDRRRRVVRADLEVGVRAERGGRRAEVDGRLRIGEVLDRPGVHRRDRGVLERQAHPVEAREQRLHLEDVRAREQVRVRLAVDTGLADHGLGVAEPERAVVERAVEDRVGVVRLARELEGRRRGRPVRRGSGDPSLGRGAQELRVPPTRRGSRTGRPRWTAKR